MSSGTSLSSAEASVLPLHWFKPCWCLLGQRGKRDIVLVLIFLATASAFYIIKGKQIPRFLIISIDGNESADPVTSYCSGKAHRRGLNQNVISYSLYGNFSDPRHYNRYAGAISYILSNISQVYPGWVMRVYSDLGPDGSLGNLKLMELFDPYPFVDLCNVTRVLEMRNITRPLFQMTWRFLPLMDPTVDRMLSRDMDSLITAREVAAVHQWLASNATFHLMHDHPFQCGLLLLGGMWGSKIYQNRQAIYNATFPIFYETQHEIQKGFDQTMLNKYLLPLTINDSMHHDSFCCEKYNTSIPFPTRRLDAEFAGQIVDDLTSLEYNHKLAVDCPEKCRPNDHPDWTRC